MSFSFIFAQAIWSMWNTADPKWCNNRINLLCPINSWIIIFFFFFLLHTLVTIQLPKLLTRLIHVLKLFIIIHIQYDYYITYNATQHNMITCASNDTNAYNFRLLKTNYIKGKNYKIKSVNNVRFSTAFVVWFEVQKYWGFRKNLAQIDILSVSREAREDLVCAFEWRSTKPFYQSVE